MPNGGIDNCSTCWFNQANDGQVGIHNEDGEQRCLIRDVEIKNPYYTYCANHPFHAPDRLEVPVGPVVEGNLRKLLFASPDTPEIRETLLRILNAMEEVPASDCNSNWLEEQAIEQLGEFGEPKALAGLLRAAQFDPFASPVDDREKPRISSRGRVWTVTVAIKALAHIAPDEAIPVIQKYLTPPEVTPNTPHGQWPAEIRFHSVVTLGGIPTERATELLTIATGDVDPVIAKQARELLESRATES